MASNEKILDRSKVRILLCDNGVKSSQEVLDLLSKCSYQVICVKSPRQVIDTLNAEGHDIDIILSEVDLPMSKGLKMLKFIMRNKELRHIPIIMMSVQDEISTVVKCLSLGAADYLVKPLRTNELLNLWTHMWRRRHMLGLAEKDILNYDLEFVASDPSDANTNSTTVFSDDTDEKSQWNVVQEINASNQSENESIAHNSKGSSLNNSSQEIPNAFEPSPKPGVISSFPRKCELKIGESSAFFSYVKLNPSTDNSSNDVCLGESISHSEQPKGAKNQESHIIPMEAEKHVRGGTWDGLSCLSSLPLGDDQHNDITTGRLCLGNVPLETAQEWNLHKKHYDPAMLLSNSKNIGHANISGVPSFMPLPFFTSGTMNRIAMPQPSPLYQGSYHDASKHDLPVLPRYSAPLDCSHVPMMTPFSYYPVGMSGQCGQIPGSHQWSSTFHSSLTEGKPTHVERREAALIKFRQKRKDRCFDKKIRYVNRKHLAERRPRVRGQFVGHANGDMNRVRLPMGYSEEEDDEEDEPLSSEVGQDSSSPERYS